MSTASACKDDDPGGSGDDSSSSGSSSTTDPTTSSTTEAVDTSSSEGGSGSEESSTGAAQVLLGGVVQDLAVAQPIADAQISLLYMPGFETVSDAEGNYTFPPLDSGAEIFAAVEPSDEYFGAVIPLTVPSADEDGQTLAQISRATVDGQITIIEEMMPEEPDLTQAIVIVRLLQNLATGATIEMEPAPNPGTFYAPDESGSPVLDQNVVEFSFLPVVVYFNVEPAAAGTLTITATHPDRECTVVHPSFPTLGEHVTLVDVDCPSM